MAKIFGLGAILCLALFQIPDSIFSNGFKLSQYSQAGFGICAILCLGCVVSGYGVGNKHSSNNNNNNSTTNHLAELANNAISAQQETIRLQAANEQRWHQTLQQSHQYWSGAVKDANETGLKYLSAFAQLGRDHQLYLERAYDKGYRIRQAGGRDFLYLPKEKILVNPDSKNFSPVHVEAMKQLQAAGGNIVEAQYREID